MKKFFALLLALCLLCGAAALASGYDQTSNTQLTATIEESYLIVIPSTLQVPFQQTSTLLPVAVTNLHLHLSEQPESETVLYVEVIPGQQLTAGENVLPYTLMGCETRDGMTGLFFQQDESRNLTVEIAQADWNAAPAGDYSDTVLFQVSVQEVAKE